VFLDQHLERLYRGCARLQIPIPDTTALHNEIYRSCRHERKAVLKLMVTRGQGGRGYRQPDNIETTRVLSLHPFPEYPLTHYSQGIVARLCATRLGLNPDLAGIKHLNRLEQVMARAEWNDPGIQEGTMTNLFYLQGDVVYTAPLLFSGVAGIIRAIIKRLLDKQGVKVVEHYFDKESLFAADEVLVCNSLIGVWPVRRIDSIHFKVGNMTKELQLWLGQSKGDGSTNAP
jgi:4-amino-4-deoxychorismate lyase